MEAKIQVIGDAGGAELAHLWRWLSTQRGLEGRIDQVQGEIGEQDLGGGVIELLSVALGSGGVAAVLPGALSTWLSSRQQTIKIAVGNVTAEFPAGTKPEVVAQYLAALKGVESRG